MANIVSGSTVLITGASSGIGWALAFEFAKDAKNIILVARRKEKLDSLAAEIMKLYPTTYVTTIACDLRSTSSMDELLANIQTKKLNVDILVNNAGHGDFTLLENAEWNKVESLINLNLVAPTYLTVKLLPSMVKNRKGGIMNISSTLGLFSIPGLATYTGSKHFMSGLTESLIMELDGKGIQVTHVCPGPVETDFEGAARARDADIIGKLSLISAKQCAEESYAGFIKGKPRIVPGKIMGMLTTLLILLPRCIHRMVFKKLTNEIRAMSK